MGSTKHIGEGILTGSPLTLNPRKSTSIRARVLRLFGITCCVALLSTTLHLISARIRSHAVQSISVPQFLHADPAEEWKDDIWPMCQPAPWDISTDYPHPRVLEYDVEEGTWMRLDVHPKTGEIIFDMLGDIYCLPADSYTSSSSSEAPHKALPVILGVPHDSDPHFSPEGDLLVWRSDAELGLENIWVKRWRGCVQENVRPEIHKDEHVTRDLREALELRISDEVLLDGGSEETIQRKMRRLLREGRYGAQRVTNETYRWVSDARFHPSGLKVVATKWITSTRSLGAGEAYEYEIPNLSEPQKPGSVAVGIGKQLVGRTLPPAWTAEQYGEVQIGPEQAIWRGDDSIVFSKNVRDTDGVYTYSKDVHKGIYSIFSKNLTTGRVETIVDTFPGGASRPELSRDGRTLAFVRRLRDKEALVLKDLETGTIRNVWYGLTYDASAISAPMGTYPSFAFTPSDSGIIIWAAGKIWHVPLATRSSGEKVAGGTPTVIPFTAHIEKKLAETRRSETDILKLETGAAQQAHAFRDLKVDETGGRVVFATHGKTYLLDLKDDQPTLLPSLISESPYYAPSFVHGIDDFVLHARWNDVNFTTFEIANIAAGSSYELVGMPLGRYLAPTLCECPGKGRKLAFVKTAGDYMTGSLVATAKPGIYIASLTLPSTDSPDTIPVSNLTFVPSDVDPASILSIKFIEKNAKLLVQQTNKAFVIDLTAGPNELGDYKQHTLAEGRMAAELAVTTTSATGGNSSVVAGNVAFVDLMQVYVGQAPKEGEKLWAKPGNSTKGIARVSLDGGHDISWSGDGKTVFWFLGPYLHSLEIARLTKCSSAIEEDRETFGIACVKDLLDYQEVVVTYPTAIQQLKTDAAFRNPNLQHSDMLIIANATILTMESGLTAEQALVEDGVLVTSGGIIKDITTMAKMDIPEGATVLDARGGFVVPGFIDAHAHWEGGYHQFPAKSWEMQAFLAYGVTTLHNPSSPTVGTFDERNRLESGQFIGPRIFQTGFPIYGAGSGDIHHDIADDAEAHAALVRIKVEGGPASFSYKNYNLPSRASRQRLLVAAQNLSMICVAEGGMNQDWNIAYIVDGFTVVEHNLPINELYDDVLTLFAMSGSGSTPTHIVNYGGAWGEQFLWATENLPDDPKLRRFVPHDLLEATSESLSRPLNSYALFNTSASIAKMVHKGLHAHIGAHGENPLGIMYHEEMWFARQGGLSNYEVLRAATSDAADTLGLLSSLGSLSPGKLADFVVYPPGIDLLGDDIRATRDIEYVARGGRLWKASTMEEVWPVKGRKQVMPPLNAD